MLLVVFGVRNKTFISFCLIKLNYNFFTDGNFYFLFEFHPSGRISSYLGAHQSSVSANNSKSYRDIWTQDIVSFFLMISYSQLRGQYTNRNTPTLDWLQFNYWQGQHYKWPDVVFENQGLVIGVKPSWLNIDIESLRGAVESGEWWGERSDLKNDVLSDYVQWNNYLSAAHSTLYTHNLILLSNFHVNSLGVEEL